MPRRRRPVKQLHDFVRPKVLVSNRDGFGYQGLLLEYSEQGALVGPAHPNPVQVVEPGEKHFVDTPGQVHVPLGQIESIQILS